MVTTHSGLLETEGFLGCRSFSAKVRKVLSKPRGTLHLPFTSAQALGASLGLTVIHLQREKRSWSPPISTRALISLPLRELTNLIW